MENSSSQNPSIIGYEPSMPFFFSGYVLDSLKRGTLFKVETYELENIRHWTLNWICRVSENVPMPPNFKSYRVMKTIEKLVDETFNDDKLKKILDDIDNDDPKSVKEFIEGNREKGTKTLLKIEENFRKSEFPQFMWMEFSRFNLAFSEISRYLEGIIDGVFKFKPLFPSQVHWKNRVAKARVQTYSSLIEGYFSALFSFWRMLLFFEMWSCEKEVDLFSKKCAWTLKNIKPEHFESLFLEFHNSISQLRQAFLRFRPQNTEIAFSSPTDWAFKQLVLMV